MTGNCKVNGLEVPWAQHYYYVAGSGACHEIYTWDGVEVDLGEPGWFDIERVADNDLGLGKLWAYCWKIETVGAIPPPFSTLYTYPDDQIYQNGETATLRAVTRSNGGSGQVHLWMKLWNFWTGEIWVGPDTFTLSPGQEHETVLTWQTPGWSIGSPEYDLTAYLRDAQDNLLASVANADAFICTGKSDEEIAQDQDEISTCWAGSESECALAIIGMVPVVGVLADMAMFVENMCRAGQMHRAGDWAGGWAAFRAGLHSYGKVAFEVWSGGAGEDIEAAVEVYEAVGSATEAAEECEDQELHDRFYMVARGGRAIPVGTFVDSLAVWTKRGLDSTGVAIADAVFLEGSCRMVVHADSSYADRDTTGLVYADIDEISDSLSFALISPQVVRLKPPQGTNPQSAASIVMESRRVQEIHLGLLHRTGSGDVAFFRYPPLAVTDSTYMQLYVEQDRIEFPVEVDFERDGVVDLLWYPIGQPSGAPWEEAFPSQMPLMDVRVVPNPARDQTVFVIQAGRELTGVHIDVFDSAGRRVRRLAKESLPPGSSSVLLDCRAQGGSTLPSGIYFYRVTSDQGSSPPQRILMVR